MITGAFASGVLRLVRRLVSAGFMQTHSATASINAAATQTSTISTRFDFLLFGGGDGSGGDGGGGGNGGDSGDGIFCDGGADGEASTTVDVMERTGTPRVVDALAASGIRDAMRAFSAFASE